MSRPRSYSNSQSVVINISSCCRHCVLDCDKLAAEGRPCQRDTYHRQVLEFHMVPLPSGITANQDLIRLLIFDQHNVQMKHTTFSIVNDDDTTPDAPFDLRAEEDGKGVVFTLRPLGQRQSYQLKITGIAYDETTNVIVYHTTFMIYISVSSYPY